MNEKLPTSSRESLGEGVPDYSIAGGREAVSHDEQIAKLQEQINGLDSHASSGNQMEQAFAKAKLEAANAEFSALEDAEEEKGEAFAEDVVTYLENNAKPTQVADGSPEKETVPSPETKESVDTVRKEYGRLKRAFRDSQREFHETLKKSFTNRSGWSKFFGLGRNWMSGDTLEAHERYMDANVAYHKFATDNGIYDKLNEWANRRNSNPDNEQVSVMSGVANRHVFKPAEQRLEIQSDRLPPGLKRIKESVLKKVGRNPKTAMVVGGTFLGVGLFVNMSGVAAGLTVGGIGKFLTKMKEKKHTELEKDTVAQLAGHEGYLDIDKLEDEYFESLNSIDKAKANTRIAATSAAIMAGSLEEILEAVNAPAAPVSGVDTPVPEQSAVDPAPILEQPAVEPTSFPEQLIMPSEPDPTDEVWADPDGTLHFAIDEAPTATLGEPTVDINMGDIETSPLYEVKPGDNLWKIIEQNLEAQDLDDGQKLYLIDSLKDNVANMSPEELKEFGIASGDPNIIQPGEQLDLSKILNEESLQTTVDHTEQLSAAQIDSIETAAQPAPTPSPEAVAPTPEPLVLDKAYISADGEMQFLTPEGQAAGAATEVVSPFARELPYQQVPGEELIDVMMQRIEAGVRTGSITLNPELNLYEMRNNLLDKFPELQRPDETYWFQRTATPGLSTEVWQAIGVPGGDPLEIPNGTKIDMQHLLNEVFDFRPEGADIHDPKPAVTPEVPAADAGRPLPEAAPTKDALVVGGHTFVEGENGWYKDGNLIPADQVDAIVPSGAEGSVVANEATLASRSEILAARQDLDLVGALERMHGYQPKISPSFEQLVTTPPPGEDAIHHVYAHMLEAYRAGDINLPHDRMEKVMEDETALYAFIEKNAEEFVGFNPFLFGKEPLGLTAGQWQELGFSQGTPKEIVAGDQIQMGKLVKLIIEHAANTINTKA